MVQYPDYTLTNEEDRAPMVIRYGYGACQYNLGDLAYPRVGVGSKASDMGWPKSLVKNGSAGSSSTSWDSPNSRILTAFGGLETNYIRNYDEPWRIFTSMYLHGGFLHITINLLCQIQTLWMLEPVRGVSAMCIWPCVEFCCSELFRRGSVTCLPWRVRRTGDYGGQPYCFLWEVFLATSCLRLLTHAILRLAPRVPCTV